MVLFHNLILPEVDKFSGGAQVTDLDPDFAVVFYCGAALLAATLVSRF
jgi:hypothetical protein